jgi:hypothetical protein
MSTIKSKTVKKKAARIARKNRLTRHMLGLEIGDRVRIIDIPPDLKDPKYDSKDAERREMRTSELFRFCVGRKFAVQDFGRYGFVELDVSANREVRSGFGRFHTIWIEPEFLEKVSRKRGSS